MLRRILDYSISTFVLAPMCQRFKIQFTHCPHWEKQLRRCHKSFESASKDKLKKPRRGWLRYISSPLTSSRKYACDCTTITILERTACSICRTNMTQRIQGGWRPNVAEEALGNYVATHPARVEQHRRSRFICSLCKKEGRIKKAEDRRLEVNGGLCCAHGLDEYRILEKSERASEQVSSSVAPYANGGDYHAVSQGMRLLSQRAPENYTAATTAHEHANESGNGYQRHDHHRGSAAISRSLLKDYLSLPGSRLSALYRPGTLPYPAQPGID